MLAPMLSALHFLTHIGLRWILASSWPATRRDRQAAYLSAHRAAGHSLLFCLLLLAIMLALADAPRSTAVLTSTVSTPG
jgi:membrane-bound metal-dependent hydrolase YbcI (DUF457 family)